MPGRTEGGLLPSAVLDAEREREERDAYQQFERDDQQGSANFHGSQTATYGAHVLFVLSTRSSISENDG